MLINKFLRLREDAVIPTIRGMVDMDCEVDKDNWLYYPTSSPLLIQAHYDSLATYKDYKLFGDQLILKANGILGADDRAGVASILEIYNRCVEAKITPPSMLFTNHEETGGGGMKEFVKRHKKEDFDHVDLFIALDRQGCHDYVQYVDNPKEVEEYIERFGFIKAHGSYSDIKDLSELTLVPSVNLSVGYYSQHTAGERLAVDEMFMTISRVMRIIKYPIGKRYPCKAKTYYTYQTYNQNWKRWNDPNYEWDSDKRDWVKKKKDRKRDNAHSGYQCELCGGDPPLQCFQAEGGYTLLLCPLCIEAAKEEEDLMFRFN
jgi:hypothetical protein